MTYYDDDEMMDDEVYFNDDDEIEDDDEEIGFSRASAINPFSTSSNLPGPGRTGSPASPTPSRDAKDAEADRQRLFGSGSRSPAFRGSKDEDNEDSDSGADRFRSSGFGSSGSLFSSSSAAPRSPTPGDGDKSEDKSRTFSSSSSPRSFPRRESGDDSSSGGGTPLRYSSSSSRPSPGTPASGSSGGTSRYSSGGSSFGRSSFPRRDGGDDDDSGGSRPSTAPRSSGLPGSSAGSPPSSPPGGSSRMAVRPAPKPGDSATPPSPADSDAKSDKGDKPSDSSGGGLGRFPRLGGKKADSADKPAGDKSAARKDDSGSGNPAAAALGGLARRMPFGGGKKDDSADKPPGDKAAARKDDSGGKGNPAAAALGGLASRMPFGGGKKDADSKDSAATSKAPSQPPASGSRSPFSGGKSPFGGGAASSDQPAKPQGPSTTTASSRQSPLGQSRSAIGGTGAGDQGKGAAPKSESQGIGQRFGSITSRLPFFGGGEDKKPEKTSKTRASKVPRTKEDAGLSLDAKLDILGVGLVFGSLVLFFSSLSGQQGAVTGAINGFFTELFGWGGVAVPFFMAAVGLWLIVRHFGEEPPEVDPVRVSGVLFGYLGLLALLMFYETFHPIYAGVRTVDELLIFLNYSVDVGRGGGVIGAELYALLVMNVGELGAVLSLVGWMFIALMLTTRTSAAEIAIFVISIYRSFQIAMHRRAQRARALRLEREEQRRLAAAQQAAQISVERPAPAELGAGATAALPEPSQSGEQPIPIEDRPIPIRMGGQMITAGNGSAEDNSHTPQPQLPAATREATNGVSGGGLLNRLRGALPIGTSGTPATPTEPAKAQSAQKPPAQAPQESQATIEEEARTATAIAAGAASAAAAAAGTLFGGGSGSSGSTSGSSGDKPTGATPNPQEVRPTTPQTQQPAASIAAPQTAQEPPPAPPARPRGTGPAPRPQPVSTFASRFGQQTAAGTPGDTTDADSTSDARQPAGNGQPPLDRQSRLDAIRQGMPARPPLVSDDDDALFGDDDDDEALTPEELEARLEAVKFADPFREMGPTEPRTRPPEDSIQALTEDDTEDDEEDDDGAFRLPRAVTQSPFAPRTPQQATPPTSPTPQPPASQPIQPKPSEPVQPAASQQAARPEPVINRPQPPEPTPQHRKTHWRLPDIRSLLSSGSEQEFDRESLVKRARIIEETLLSFGAPGRVVEINTGPVITQFGVEPDYLSGRGGKKNRVKVSAIAQLDKDLQLSLGAKSIRIEAPVPGKGFVGVEVPNEEASLVSLRDVMESEQYRKIKSPLAIGLGQSVDGTPVAADLTAMPHLLIAGTTGSGKSVMVNAIISSLLLRNTPEDVKFIMVDPKRVELTGYNGIPHLIAPVVVELERIVGVLKWVTREMDERYKKFSNAGARNITDYNDHLEADTPKMPYIVVFIDELADLMMLAPEETERVITRIAALARATGIHLVIATQRPSVDVVTGLIKANFPARIAFAVAGSVDSRVILDQPGAERLLGRGDMLYMSGDSPAPLRLQGVFVSDMEINNINRYWRTQTPAGYTSQKPITALMADRDPSEQSRSVIPRGERFTNPPPPSTQMPTGQRALWDTPDDLDDDEAGDTSDHEDELYDEAVELIRRLNKASVSLLQRRLRIGYTRAARLIDTMEAEGIIGPPVEGSKPRKVLPPKS